jgi:hypothetical protein
MSIRGLWGKVKFNGARWWGAVTPTRTPACMHVELELVTTMEITREAC